MCAAKKAVRRGQRTILQMVLWPRFVVPLGYFMVIPSDLARADQMVIVGVLSGRLVFYLWIAGESAICDGIKDLDRVIIICIVHIQIGNNPNVWIGPGRPG